MLRVTISFIILSFFLSCKKRDEGPNGQATIKGKIYVKDYNSTFSRINDQYYGAKEDVFIIYGDDDLFYSLEGFERMGDMLTSGGSEVSIMRIPQSGRMVLFDNGRDRILDLISILLQ